MLLKCSHARFAAAASTKGYLDTSIAAQFNVPRAIKGRDFPGERATFRPGKKQQVPSRIDVTIMQRSAIGTSSVSVPAVNGKVSGAGNFDEKTVASRPGDKGEFQVSGRGLGAKRPLAEQAR